MISGGILRFHSTEKKFHLLLYDLGAPFVSILTLSFAFSAGSLDEKVNLDNKENLEIMFDKKFASY